MSYDPQTWADGPEGATPINAARLTHMEEGIAAAGALLTAPDQFSASGSHANVVPLIPAAPSVVVAPTGGALSSADGNTVVPWEPVPPVDNPFPDPPSPGEDLVLSPDYTILGDNDGDWSVVLTTAGLYQVNGAVGFAVSSGDDGDPTVGDWVMSVFGYTPLQLDGPGAVFRSTAGAVDVSFLMPVLASMLPQAIGVQVGHSSDGTLSATTSLRIYRVV